MKRPIVQRVRVIRSLLAGKINSQKASDLLGCSKRTVRRYKRTYLVRGRKGLVDKRHSNYQILTASNKETIISLKKKDRWRSARNIRDHLGLNVHELTVWRVVKDAGLTRENIERVKPIRRFEAAHPNDLWQTDIMGKIDFPRIGTLYLIATLDDHSRFVPAGKWFKRQGKMNVFQVWYESLARWGLPNKMLQDEGSQFKARTRFGQADYQWYANALGIKLIWVRRAQTKGKIERFWRFVQDDFVREVWKAQTVDEVNGAFKIWLAKYNYKFKSRYFGGATRAEKYKPSERKADKVELQTLLVVEERRKVSRESTISLYGQKYFVPSGYINCRIWVKIIGNKVYFEANGEIFWKTKLKLS
ncbi:DDE-type integrase/transposase/recombinase [Patescibacteria group bacterium]|nr:DDE-type integrase/transposase/recombinase [Patescibacteria group bacterium]